MLESCKIATTKYGIPGQNHSDSDPTTSISQRSVRINKRVHYNQRTIPTPSKCIAEPIALAQDKTLILFQKSFNVSIRK